MIIGVAVQFKNGQEIRLLKPNRHADCFRVAEEQYHLKPTECVGSHGLGSTYACWKFSLEPGDTQLVSIANGTQELWTTEDAAASV